MEEADVNSRHGKPYDLEERTFQFAKRVLEFINKLPKTIANLEIIRQLVRASGSVGTNYIEANENLGKKDFQMHVKIARKESKESRFWLRLCECAESERGEQQDLIQESTEFIKIFSAILKKTQ
jgi:four helix bundle protein